MDPLGMRYADRESVLTQLHYSDENPEHAVALTRLELLENGIADAIDTEIGRSFGDPISSSRTIRIAGYMTGVLLLPEIVREVTAITIDGEEIDPAAYELCYFMRGGAKGIRFDGVTIVGRVVVTGIWDSDPIPGEVPADIREAATMITVDTFRIQESSPAGEMGPDGLVVPVRNPWNNRLVRDAIRRHRVTRRRVAV